MNKTKKHDVSKKKANDIVTLGNIRVNKGDMNDPEIQKILNFAAQSQNLDTGDMLEAYL